MSVTPLTAAPSAASTAAASTASTEAGTEYQTFLKMLTTQLRNQDPMNPMESSDFAVQLATFSGVEQQVKTNDLLSAIIGGGALSGIGQYASWIGMEAQVPAAAWFDGTPLTLAPVAAAGADGAKLVVTDSDGQTVMSTPVTLDGKPVVWSGLDAQGQPLPSGRYAFNLQSYEAGNLIGTEPVAVYAEVVETRMATDGTAMLIMKGGAEVAASEATALRRID